jgi:hypothetical protein
MKQKANLKKDAKGPMRMRYSTGGTPPRSKAGQDFDRAFLEARKAGKMVFTWNGKSYGTRRASETKEQHREHMSNIASTPKPMPSLPKPARPEPQLQRPATSSPKPATPATPQSSPSSTAGAKSPVQFNRALSEEMRNLSNESDSKPKTSQTPTTQSSKKTGPVNNFSNLKQDNSRPNAKLKMGGSFLEPDKELKFGGMKYEMGGMEECGPGRPCPNARKAAKTKKKQNKNLSGAQRRYMR